MEEKTIKEKVKIAEESVGDIQDAGLKVKAFELVLQKLLQTDTVSGTSVVNQSKRKPKHTRKVGMVSKLKKEIKKTRLKFSEEQLVELKKFYDCFKPTGWESNIFILCIFLKEKINQETFHEGDVEYCYQQLINLRTTARPTAMSLDNIKQTLSWLAAPSRKKQWLEIGGDGIFRVSAAGIIHFKELETQNETEENTIK